MPAHRFRIRAHRKIHPKLQRPLPQRRHRRIVQRDQRPSLSGLRYHPPHIRNLQPRIARRLHPDQPHTRQPIARLHRRRRKLPHLHPQFREKLPQHPTRAKVSPGGDRDCIPGPQHNPKHRRHRRLPRPKHPHRPTLQPLDGRLQLRPGWVPCPAIGISLTRPIPRKVKRPHKQRPRMDRLPRTRPPQSTPHYPRRIPHRQLNLSPFRCPIHRRLMAMSGSPLNISVPHSSQSQRDEWVPPPAYPPPKCSHPPPTNSSPRNLTPVPATTVPTRVTCTPAMLFGTRPTAVNRSS